MVLHVAAFGPGGLFVGSTPFLLPSGDPLLGETSTAYIAPPALTRICVAGAAVVPTPPLYLGSSTLDPQRWLSLYPLNFPGEFDSPPNLLDLLDEDFAIPAWSDWFVSALGLTVAPNQGNLIIWLGDATRQPVHAGPIIRAYFTGLCASIKQGWQEATLNFEQYLPPSDYAVIGGFAVCDFALAFRLVPASGALYRPGGICQQFISALTDPLFRDGRMGEWMRFNYLEPPALEIFFGFGGGVSNAVSGVLDLVPISQEQPENAPA